MPLGFDPDGVLTVTATQSGRPREERQAYEAELLRAVRDVPGVTTAGIAFPLPMNGVYERSAEYAPRRSRDRSHRMDDGLLPHYQPRLPGDDGSRAQIGSQLPPDR